MDKSKKILDKSSAICVIKGSMISIIVSLICILFFAFVVKLFGLSDGSLKIVNQIIKAFSIFIGTFCGLKKCNQNGLLKGLVIGLCYTFFAFLIFSALNGNFSFEKSLLNDVIFGGITGAICGVISVNAKKKTASA